MKSSPDARKQVGGFVDLELLTIFPDDSQESKDFWEFLNKKPNGFELIWGEQQP